MRTSTTLAAALCCSLLPTLAAAEPVIVVPSGDSAALQSAFSSVPDGGVIELEPGTYVAPSGGFDVNTPNRSFTLRGADGGEAVLSGASSRTILRYINATPDLDDSVVFENLIFADGLSTTNGLAGGVTLIRVQATFVDCEFRDNVSDAPSTGGGGVFAFDGSTVHFTGCTWLRNSATNEGGGLRLDDASLAYVHDSRFLENRVNLPGHRTSAAGGAIHLTNARARVSNTRFEGNQGVIGGAIFAFGGWENPNVTQLVVTNSTFFENSSGADPGMNPPPPDTGGAIHSEDDVEVLVYNSRFEDNHGQKGGAMSQYRSIVEVHGSLFRGNSAEVSGGTISAGSEDANDATTDFGAINRPSAALTIHGSLIQGDPVGSDPSPENGGCLFVTGDSRRTYGLAGVSQMGDATVNRAVVDVHDSAFVGCKAEAPAGDDVNGKGGALNLAHVDLTLLRSLILDSQAIGNFGQGGGLRVFLESDATIEDTTFAENTASFNAAGAVISGSTLLMDGCQFFKNTNLSGNLGSAMLTGPNVNLFGFVDLEMDGTVQNTTFSDHATIPLRENDRTDGPINDLQYAGNDFFPAGGDVYSNQLVGNHTVSSLNSVVVTRNAGVGNTNKAPQGNNSGLGAEPDLGALLAVPPEILATNANGDPAPPTESFLAYAWCGDAATLDGSSLTENTGLMDAGSGIHTLSVGGNDFLATISDAAIPAATLTPDPVAIDGGQSADLSWSTTGTLFEVTIDRGVSIPNTSSGSVTVTPDATTEYRVTVITREGCASGSAKVYVDEPPGELIFTDGFESGDTSAWSSSTGP